MTASLSGLLWLALSCTAEPPRAEVAKVEEVSPQTPQPVVQPTVAPSDPVAEPVAVAPAPPATALATASAPPPELDGVTVGVTSTATSVPLATAFPGSAASMEGHRIVPKTMIAYATGKTALTGDSADALTEVKLLLDTKPAITLVRVEVHTDSMGSDDANLALSKGRALEVARGLVGLGVPCRKLVAVGFGETKPLAANDTAESRAKNRRTEFHVAALNNRLLGGAPSDGGGDVAGDPCK